MRKGRFVLGILCLVGAVVMYVEISGFESQNVSIIPIFPITLKQEVQICNSGWGDFMGSAGTWQCIKLQVVYYSPWILGIIGIVLLIKSRSYYYGSRKNRYR